MWDKNCCCIREPTSHNVEVWRNFIDDLTSCWLPSPRLRTYFLNVGLSRIVRFSRKFFLYFCNKSSRSLTHLFCVCACRSPIFFLGRTRLRDLVHPFRLFIHAYLAHRSALARMPISHLSFSSISSFLPMTNLLLLPDISVAPVPKECGSSRICTSYIPVPPHKGLASRRRKSKNLGLRKLSAA